MPLLKEENFVPVLYVVEIDSLDEAIAIQNDVPQGLSSAIFTDSLRSAERFLSTAGSDCGIANVNIGTSGAEIGGALSWSVAPQQRPNALILWILSTDVDIVPRPLVLLAPAPSP